ncbi:hypothetical protein [Teredinibacter purpureus]|uniref:hypothetical protein n=1 Tax=Teredinibacter purpureus TaxID=2731756 RepID=UPI0005F82B31|nr:hypothetical protein [Teredinibacter purpureus]
MSEITRHLIDLENLPEYFPTQKHEGQFWEALGRAVATFGFLEDTLCRAIYAFSVTQTYKEDEIEDALKKILVKVRRSMSDQLWGLIETFGKAVREHPEATIENLDDLIQCLKEAAEIRNVICHASWPKPNDEGFSIPRFVNKKELIFLTPISIKELHQTRENAAELVCAVANTVTHMGWQFPGTNGPGKKISQ